MEWRRQCRNCWVRTIWLLPIFYLLWSTLVWAQSPNVAADQNKAHRLVEATIQALGGQAWLDLRTLRIRGSMAGFFQGNPTGAMSDVTITRDLPDKQRIDLAKGKVVQIYVGSRAWEVTFQGKKPLPAQPEQDFLRWHDHSLGVVLRRWARDPATVLVDEGQSLVERQLVDRITLINSTDDGVTLDLDAESHLPLRLSFTWRDPRFHDKNLDAVEYDNYQRVGGIATPFTVTWKHNGETVRQCFLRGVEYNLALSPDLFNPDQAAAHLK